MASRKLAGSSALLERSVSARADGAGGRSSDPPGEHDNAVQVLTEFARGLGDWLISHQVGLVCSTSRTGYLLFVGVRADGVAVPSAASFSSVAMGCGASSQRARGLVFVAHYAVVTVSLRRHGNSGALPLHETMAANGTAPCCGLLVIDLRNGDIVQWLRLRGEVTELFDVGVIANIRCPRGIGPNAPGLQEAMRGEELGGTPYE